MTADLLNLGIADINFTICCMDDVTVVPPPPVYLPFITSPDPGRHSLTVRITLELHNMPHVDDATKIFDSGQSWSMYRHRDEYIMALSPPDLSDRTVWLAKFQKDFADVAVYCSEMLQESSAGRTRVLNPVLYPLDQLLVIHILAQKGGALVHAAGVHIHDKGFIFPGCSGAGKSTISGRLTGKGHLGLLSDDRVVIRKSDGGFVVYGTPWAGEAGVAENRRAVLSGIFFIHQGARNEMREIGGREAFEKLMPVTSVPWYDRDMMTDVLSFCEDLASNVPAYDLFFRPDINPEEIFEKFITD